MKRILFFSALAFSLAQVNAQLSSINENFNSFTPGQTNTIPQNGWTKITPLVTITTPFPTTTSAIVYVEGSNGNNYVNGYSLFAANSEFFLVSPQIVAPDGTTALTFDAAFVGGSGTSYNLQPGLLSNPEDATTFTAVGEPISVTSFTAQTYTIAVPASSSQYIAFRMSTATTHTAMSIDNVVYGSSLAVSEVNAANDIKFAIKDQSSLEFSSKKYTVSGVHIYTANGQKVASGKASNNSFNISNLKTGIYFLIIETAEGVTVKSKFLKK